MSAHENNAVFLSYASAAVGSRSQRTLTTRPRMPLVETRRLSENLRSRRRCLWPSMVAGGEWSAVSDPGSRDPAEVCPGREGSPHSAHPKSGVGVDAADGNRLRSQSDGEGPQGREAQGMIPRAAVDSSLTVTAAFRSFSVRVAAQSSEEGRTVP